MVDSTNPAGSKDIAAATGLEAKIISRITTLKKQGLADSPVRCKCAIAEEGRSALAGC